MKEVFVIFGESEDGKCSRPLKVETTSAAAKGYAFDTAPPEGMTMKILPFTIGGTGKPRAKKGEGDKA